MKVAYFILNPFDFDSRARLEVETIKSMGHRVEVVATTGGELNNYLGCPIHRVSQSAWPSRKIRFIQYNLKASSIGIGLKADVYHAVDLDVLFAANRGAGKNGGKLVYESRELYTELQALEGRRTVKALWRGLERRLIGKADKIITINNSIAVELMKRYAVRRPAIIRNVAPSAKRIQPVDLRLKLKIPENHRIIIYQGVLRDGQGLAYLLGLMPMLNDVTLVILGDGPSGSPLRALSFRLGIGDRVRFMGKVSPDALLNHTVSADVGALLMEDVALNNRLALPQKLFQYLSAGVPQIVSSMPEIAGFVQKEKTGVVVSLGDPEKDAAIISEFLADKARYGDARNNCVRAARENNWEIESLVLTRIYRELEEN